MARGIDNDDAGQATSKVTIGEPEMRHSENLASGSVTAKMNHAKMHHAKMHHAKMHHSARNEDGTAF